MKYKTLGYSLIVFLLFTGVFMFISKRESNKSIENVGSNFAVHLRSSANSGKIHVNDNWSETKTAGICTGEGTESNPYSLKNLVIDAEGIGHGIHVENTTEYFKIENCTIFNSGGEIHDSGIMLENVTNGYLINNTTHDNNQGMSIYSCLNLRIERNRLFDSTGMKIYWTNNTFIYLNTFMNSHIMVFSQWSYMQYYSQVEFSYTFNGNSFTNFLGNYWIDHSGPDGDGDGIVDLPYIVYSYVPDNPDLKDFYPLISPIDAYSNIKQVESGIPGFNLISLLSIIGIIATIFVIINRKSVNKSKIVFS